MHLHHLTMMMQSVWAVAPSMGAWLEAYLVCLQARDEIRAAPVSRSRAVELISMACDSVPSGGTSEGDACDLGGWMASERAGNGESSSE